MGSTTSSTRDRPAFERSLEVRLCVGERGDETLPSFRMLPTNSEDSLSEPAGSTFFTGRIVSIPVPRSASLSTVPGPSVDVRAAYDARLAERGEPEYAGGAPKNKPVNKSVTDQG